MQRPVHRVVAMLAALAFVVLSCGSDSGSSPNDDPSQQRYAFTLQDGSTISTPDGNEEPLSGRITTAVRDLCCNVHFGLSIERLSLRSRSFAIEGTEGAMDARLVEGLRVSAPVDINGQRTQLTGGGGLSTYFEGGRLEQIPKRFRGVILRTDDDIKLTLYASR